MCVVRSLIRATIEPQDANVCTTSYNHVLNLDIHNT